MPVPRERYQPGEFPASRIRGRRAREALRAARHQESSGDTGRKLEAVRTAARHSFPSGNIREMLAEIERGFGGETGW